MTKFNEKTLFFLCITLFFVSVGTMVYYFMKSDTEIPNKYERTIDSLVKENLVLDSLYDNMKNKGKEIKILYKKVSIKQELDSLNNLKNDLEKLRTSEPAISDSITPDSLRDILIKQFNQD